MDGVDSVPFPFLPFGMIVALVVLGSALTLFGLAAFALERSAMELRGSILPGMVRGVRAWIAEPEPMPAGEVGISSTGTRPGTPPGGQAALEELPEGPAIEVDRVRRDRR